MSAEAGRIKVRVWDLPTRLFHWLLALAIASAWFTGENGGNWLVWHGRLGLLMVGLVVFRLLWGLVGSTQARFATFFPTPARIKAYLTGQWQGLGHNPLGALSVFGLLALVCLQVATGLFAYNDDIAYEGHLYTLVSSRGSDLATGLHHQVFDLLAILAALHVAAIVFHVRIKKNNLVKPMITGTKEVDASQGPAEGLAKEGGGPAIFLLTLAIALGAIWAASGVWIEKQPPAAAAPAW